MEKIEKLEERKPMTRAEWVKQARIECEKHLEYTPRKKAEEGTENYMVPGELPVKQVHSRGVQERMIREKVAEKEERSDNVQTNSKSAVRSFKFTIFRIRIVAASLIVLGVIAMDFFHVETETVNSEVIEQEIASNDTIEKLEESVSAFIQNTIIPVFKGDSANNGVQKVSVPEESLQKEQLPSSGTDEQEDIQNEATETIGQTGVEEGDSDIDMDISNEVDTENQTYIEEEESSDTDEQVGILDKEDGVTKSETKEDLNKQAASKTSESTAPADSDTTAEEETKN